MKKIMIVSTALAWVVFLFSCKKDVPGYGYVSLIHKDADSVYSYIHIPNSFTPNGDGINDVFYAVETEIDPSGYFLGITNKAGVLIFQTTNYQGSWDGKYKGDSAPSDSYFYHIVAKDNTGYQYDYHGEVYLLK